MYSYSVSRNDNQSQSTQKLFVRSYCGLIELLFGKFLTAIFFLLAFDDQFVIQFSSQHSWTAQAFPLFVTTTVTTIIRLIISQGSDNYTYELLQIVYTIMLYLVVVIQVLLITLKVDSIITVDWAIIFSPSWIISISALSFGMVLIYSTQLFNQIEKRFVICIIVHIFLSFFAVTTFLILLVTTLDNVDNATENGVIILSPLMILLAILIILIPSFNHVIKEYQDTVNREQRNAINDQNGLLPPFSSLPATVVRRANRAKPLFEQSRVIVWLLQIQSNTFKKVPLRLLQQLVDSVQPTPGTRNKSFNDLLAMSMEIEEKRSLIRSTSLHQTVPLKQITDLNDKIQENEVKSEGDGPSVDVLKEGKDVKSTVIQPVEEKETLARKLTSSQIVFDKPIKSKNPPRGIIGNHHEEEHNSHLKTDSEKTAHAYEVTDLYDVEANEKEVYFSNVSQMEMQRYGKLKVHRRSWTDVSSYTESSESIDEMMGYRKDDTELGVQHYLEGNESDDESSRRRGSMQKAFSSDVLASQVKAMHYKLKKGKNRMSQSNEMITRDRDLDTQPRLVLQSKHDATAESKQNDRQIRLKPILSAEDIVTIATNSLSDIHNRKVTAGINGLIGLPGSLQGQILTNHTEMESNSKRRSPKREELTDKKGLSTTSSVDSMHEMYSLTQIITENRIEDVLVNANQGHFHISNSTDSLIGSVSLQLPTQANSSTLDSHSQDAIQIESSQSPARGSSKSNRIDLKTASKDSSSPKANSIRSVHSFDLLRSLDSTENILSQADGKGFNDEELLDYLIRDIAEGKSNDLDVSNSLPTHSESMTSTISTDPKLNSTSQENVSVSHHIHLPQRITILEETKRQDPVMMSQESSQMSLGRCVVCINHPADTILMPCGHAVLCLECTVLMIRKQMRPCPLCRSDFDEIVRITTLPFNIINSTNLRVAASTQSYKLLSKNKQIANEENTVESPRTGERTVIDPSLTVSVTLPTSPFQLDGVYCPDGNNGFQTVMV